MLRLLILTLTVLPSMLIFSAIHENARAIQRFADVNASGSLRYRSLWLYASGRPETKLSESARDAQQAQMRAIRDRLRLRYPQDVAATDAAWVRFSGQVLGTGHVDWQSTEAMREAADSLTRQIEKGAAAQAHHSSSMLLLGLVGLVVSTACSFGMLHRLQRTEQRQRQLNAILDTTSDLIGMCDAQGQVIYLNRAFRRFLELPEKAPLAGLKLEAIHTPEARVQLVEESLPAIFQSGTWMGETVLLHPTQGPVTMSQVMQAHYKSEGSLEAISAITRDISASKADKLRLQESEARFRSAIEAMQEGFLVQARGGGVLMANRCAEEILGLSSTQMVGQEAMREGWRTIHENGLPFAREEHPSQIALQTGKGQSDIILGLDKPDQPSQWLSISSAPLFHAGEEAAYAAVTTFIDITAQKEAADALRRAEEDLRTVVHNAPLILFSLDKNGRIATSQGKGLAALNLTPEAIVGKKVSAIFGEAAQAVAQVEEARNGKTVVFTLESGGHIWDGRCSPQLSDQGVEGVIGVLFDVTDRSQAETALRQGEERLRLLYDITAANGLSFPEKLDQLMQMGCDQFDMETGHLGHIEADRYTLVSAYPPETGLEAGMTCDVSQTYCQVTLQQEQVYCFGNGSQSEWRCRPAYALFPRESYFGTTVQVSGLPYGTLCFTSRRPRETSFSAADQDLLRLMAKWVGEEIERQEAERRMRDYSIVLEFQMRELENTNRRMEEVNARLESLATTDSLTGLCNRRAVGERLTCEFDRARRYGTPLSLVMLDVDHFKQYNDTFGHLAGDTVLQTVAQVLQAQARTTDLPARYGGEEFMIVLPETDATGAMTLAERVRIALEEAPWPQRAITASFGVCSLQPEMQEPDALISAADQALYASKAGGRNRVIHHAAPRMPAPAQQAA